MWFTNLYMWFTKVHKRFTKQVNFGFLNGLMLFYIPAGRDAIDRAVLGVN